jgi:hypothetical protein
MYLSTDDLADRRGRRRILHCRAADFGVCYYAHHGRASLSFLDAHEYKYSSVYSLLRMSLRCSSKSRLKPWSEEVTQEGESHRLSLSHYSNQRFLLPPQKASRTVILFIPPELTLRLLARPLPSHPPLHYQLQALNSPAARSAESQQPV